MKKYQALVWMVIGVCFIGATVPHAACQPTPPEDAVVNKGEGQLEEKIKATPAKRKPF